MVDSNHFEDFFTSGLYEGQRPKIQSSKLIPLHSVISYSIHISNDFFNENFAVIILAYVKGQKG